MEIQYTCRAGKGSNRQEWTAQIRMISIRDPYEMVIQARGKSFHVIAGHQINGCFICIPNWNVGSELSYFGNIAWNQDRLKASSKLSPTDINTIVTGLAELQNYL